MFHIQRRGVSRIAAVMLASSVMVGSGLALAGVAVADSGSGAPATLTGLAPGEFGSIKIGADNNPTTGGLIQLATGAGTLDTYCINVHNETAESAKYQETDWSALSSDQYSSPTASANKGKILWILQNSFPNVSDLGVLAHEAGVGAFSKGQAAAATQAAIWQLSDGVAAEPVDGDAKKLTDYLIKSAVGDVTELNSLALAPTSVSGVAGALLGPVKVSSTSTSVDVSVDAASAGAGVVITDSKGKVLSGKDGKLLSPAKTNDTLFVKAPAGSAAGTATLSASASAVVKLGRVFVSADINVTKTHSQTLILAGSSPVTVKAGATASWTAAGPTPTAGASAPAASHSASASATPSGTPTATPSQAATPVPSSSSSPATTGGLAFTGGGGQTPLLAGIAGALVLIGGGAVFAMRRRGRHGRTAA